MKEFMLLMVLLCTSTGFTACDSGGVHEQEKSQPKVIPAPEDPMPPLPERQ